MMNVTGTVLLGALLLVAPAEAGEGILPAVNEIPADSPVGKRPYEMEWAGRTETRPPVVGFEDLSGWRLALESGATGRLERSREQILWGATVAKLTYRGTSASSRLRILPPKPIPILDRFDSIDLWCYGNNWGWQPDPKTPQVDLSLVLRDSKGKEIPIALTKVRWKEWWLVHKRIPKETLEGIEWPASLASICISGAANTEDRILYFDSLSCYTEPLEPLRFAPRPRRNIVLFPGQSPGLNTGPGTLPFPTREETILPANIEKEYRNRVVRTGPEEKPVFELRYDGRDGRVVYRFDPGRPRFSGLSVEIDGRRACRPIEGSGVRIAGAAGEPEIGSARIDGDSIAIMERHGTEGPRVEYRLRIWQKSLVLDAITRGGEATELSFGRVAGARDPEIITIPFITYGASNPPVLLLRLPDGRAAFLSIWPDWYRSNGSEPFSSPRVFKEGEETYVHVNGGVRYHPKTDGKRNDLFERAFITVSPVFEETLPTIANPPSPHGTEAGERLWQESWGPSDYAKEHARSRRLRAYGIEFLTQLNHEITWRDGGESFTLRLRAAPGKGGDEALKGYIAGQRSLGWRAGLYTNYTDFAPVNGHWDPDAVQRTPEGDWRPAWPRCYALKPARAVELDAELAPKVQAKYGTNAAYTDVHTAVAPWHYCDYDARVPGAGTFAQTFYAYGEILIHDRGVYGPTWSEGTYHWLYAGLASGNYGLCYSGPNLSEYPIFPVFDLLKIHPLECDIGIPWTAGFFRRGGWEKPEVIEQSIDHFIAATVGYGHIGWLVEEAHGIRRTCRSYYLLQALQKRYAQVEVDRIRYRDPKRGMVSVSDALSSGAWREAQIEISYRNGLVVKVNGSRTLSWKLDDMAPGGGELDLGELIVPPFGWVASDPKDGFLALSGLAFGEGRIDLVWAPRYVYLDARDRTVSTPCGIEAKGGVAVRAPLERRLSIIDIGGNTEIGFGGGSHVIQARGPEEDVRRVLARMGTGEDRRGQAPLLPVRAEAFDETGKSLGPAEILTKATWHRLRCVENAIRYEVDLSEGK